MCIAVSSRLSFQYTLVFIVTGRLIDLDNIKTHSQHKRAVAELSQEKSVAHSELNNSKQEIAKIESTINDIKSKADSLADRFRDYYQRAKEAYDSDDKALAKELKDEGYIYEQKCRSMNNDVHRLREYRHLLTKKYNNAVAECKKWDSYISQLHKHKSSILIPMVANANRFGLKEDDVEAVLQEFSPHHLKQSVTLVYFSGIIRNAQLGQVLGNYDYELKHIIINSTSQILDHDESLRWIKHVIAHELGHAVYHNILTDKQKVKWHKISETMGPVTSSVRNRWENENIRDRENFAECYRIFYNEIKYYPISGILPKNRHFVDFFKLYVE